MAQPKSRVPLFAGLVAAGGVGYYLYKAGGNPKVAEKQVEGMLHPLSDPDLSRASAKIKSEIPGRAHEAQKEGEKWASQAGAKLDSAVEKSKAELSKAEGKFEAYRKDLGAEAMKKIDAADAKIEQEAAKAKSGISSWFGGK
ncbi:calcofluor white hypersensitive protein [Drepanopeziza brunnea f. sp. 'multigermtubi' MB_m1]|uniref:Calcofluor white hypersensitive protein n=1 Tax=Marssonina brunnea f. sp. multigermtubi (strain MB_m1) TaxID=1072389 RepID=K1WU03_MARBU|nr:calcofluor white hypersensitive protein [Drepanopeziza brunnea f. sp. 'multigermtubi' MB_m1]EKD16536.1 calcofluor white hypersensitive protein [Drepanopeziza brunnea f. sp. 'multigermtubi' MB_m1]